MVQLYTWDLGCLSSRRPRQAYTWHMVTSYTVLHLVSCSPTLCAAPGRILLLTSSVSRTAAPRSSRLRLPTSLARLPRLSRGSSCHIIMVTVVTRRAEDGGTWRQDSMRARPRSEVSYLRPRGAGWRCLSSSSGRRTWPT